MKNEMIPSVSIVIVNYNGKKYIEQCVKSVLSTNYPNFEVIVVDNGSEDASVESLKKKYGNRIRIICNERNLGPAEARNIAAIKSQAEILAFLDNDCMPDKEWLREAIKYYIEDKKIGASQCKLILAEKNEGLIDSIGYYMGQFGFLVQRVPLGKVKDEGQFNYSTKIFGTKSAGMLIRKKVFDEINGFDPDYFIYMEETDLCWRVWLRGYVVIFTPASKVIHFSGTTKKILPSTSEYLLYFHGSKNYIMTLIKNCETRQLITTVPINIIIWLGMVIGMTIKRRSDVAAYVLAGVVWNIKNMSNTINKRKEIQAYKMNDVPDEVIKNKPLSYYLEVFGRF